ncbi:MAG: bifunctional DNA-formamidopyrimidine glycosylase/DNA-(apurinic or apyrimidinic site) lyase [Cellulomonas sp.]|nr:bifunctional DNA-formamidopyrimidine glycosylase/DNA-(apurinic or apyrimidinic site) lyase [Cellulomonas sp.]
MPELPEVETVRAGLADHVLGRTVLTVQVYRESAARRAPGGSIELVSRLRGRTFVAAVRRGKFCWLTLDGRDEALLVHLGMSGQLIVRAPGPDPAPQPHPHLRVRLGLDDGSALDFIDQRTFGHLTVVDLEPTADGLPAGAGSPDDRIPAPVGHIARDLLDPHLDTGAVVARVRARRTGLKRGLLDQTLVSGVGNIYADEGLWRARLHYARPTETARPGEVTRLLTATAEVMREALAVGGTSFDALYVNVNGASGYFDRSLTVYGQTGRPCPRCGTAIRRDSFMNRSSFSCPRCQPRPRHGHW